MPVLKRPSSAADLQPKKRPAAASSIRDVVSELKQPHGDDDNEDVQKFHKMLSQGSLPDHIVHMYNVESKKSNEGVRAYQTKLINSLFQKKEDGSYKIMTDKQEFQEYRKIFHSTVAKDKTEALPRTLMLASHFHGNEQLMQRALDNGELVSKKDTESKIEYLQFRKFSSAEVRGNEEGEQVAGSKKLSRDQAHSLAFFMSKLKWKFELTKAGAANEKALEDGNEIPDKVKKLAQKAKDACERLLKDGSKLVGQAETQKLIKDGYKTLSTHINNLNNLLMFNELPDKAIINKDSLENFIGTIAQDVDQYHGEIQAAKARAKAKS
eukprot:s2564_g22.t1